MKAKKQLQFVKVTLKIEKNISVHAKLVVT